MSCKCKLEAIVPVDERGQMVLPKDFRERAKLNPGDKLALVSWENEGEVCCIGLIKADKLGSVLSGTLGELMGMNPPAHAEVVSASTSECCG